MAASPGLPPARPRTSAVAQWLGPAVALSDASISAGLLWFAALIAALRAGAVTFGLTMTAVAMLAAWQAAGARGPAAVTRQSPSGDAALAAQVLPPSHRLPAAALAGAVGFAGVLDTRLAGAVVGAAALASFMVVAALRPRRAGGVTQPAGHGPPLPVLAGAGLLIRSWMQVGVAAACSAAVARYSLGAALVLVSAAAAYDAAAHLSASGRPPGLRGPLAGVTAAATAVFALTGLSVPPFAPSNVIGFGLLAVLTLPLGPALARPNTAPEIADGPRRAWQRLTREWAVRRLDSLSVTALAWMWALGLLAI